jgi:hypothetical protein
LCDFGYVFDYLSFLSGFVFGFGLNVKVIPGIDIGGGG